MKQKTKAAGKKATTVNKKTAVANVPSIAEIAKRTGMPFTLPKAEGTTGHKFNPRRIPGVDRDLRYKRVPGETVKRHHLYYYSEKGAPGGKFGCSGDLEVRYVEIQAYNRRQLSYVQYWETLGFMESDVKKELTRLGYHEHNEWFSAPISVINKVVENLQRKTLQ